MDVQKARLDGLSGTIVQNADLGLPSLPGVGGAGSSDMTSLVSGSHTLRLWYAGPNRVRLALLGSLGESDLVRNGTDLWTWSSKDKSATHRKVAAHEAGHPGTLADSSPMTPQQAADAALSAISPIDQGEHDGTATVAGRPAYELVLQPKDAGSLVESVHIAIDGKTHMPTRVQVFAKNSQDPSFEVGFTSFDPTTPASSAFSFNPPPGTKVTDGIQPEDSGRRLPSRRRRVSGAARPDKPRRQPRIVGTGWSLRRVAKLPAGATSGAESAEPGCSRSCPRSVAPGAQDTCCKGTLFSALLTDDGRVVVGAVAPEALYAALAS